MSVSQRVALEHPSLASSPRSYSTHDLTQLGLRDVTIAAATIRKIGDRAPNFDEVAGRIVRYLCTPCTDSTLTQPAGALVRLFRTQPFDQLDEERQQFAPRLLNGAPCPGTLKCFSLAASAGQEPEWNNLAQSKRYKVVPVRDISFIGQFPMMGAAPHPVRCRAGRVALAHAHCPHRSARGIVQRVLRTGGGGESLRAGPRGRCVAVWSQVSSRLRRPAASGDLFAVILFSKVAISPEDADRFCTLALATKLALLPFETASSSLDSLGH